MKRGTKKLAYIVLLGIICLADVVFIKSLIKTESIALKSSHREGRSIAKVVIGEKRDFLSSSDCAYGNGCVRRSTSRGSQPSQITRLVGRPVADFRKLFRP